MPNLYEPSGKHRIQSIDILRGVIMIIMALDHTRDFFHNPGALGDPTDMATTTPFFFCTRWITHFCAPNFVFLSGISAYLAGTRRTKNDLSAFLIKRGLWLILIEIVFLSFAFTLSPFYNVIVLQVLWAIGFSMVILGLIVKLPLRAIAVIGVAIFFGHDILDYLQLPKSGAAFVLDNLFFTTKGTVFPYAPHRAIFDLYAVIPWTGVMLLGYVFGSLYTSTVDQNKRIRMLRYTGVFLLGLFVVLRLLNLYGDPAPWAIQRNGIFTVLSFFNVSKYPPSLLYCCMTIGMGLVVLSLTEHIQNKLTAVFIVYGNVPFFYYVLHFYMLRAINLILFFGLGYSSPDTFGFNLFVVYLIWLFVIASLYFPCRWFGRYKKTHNQWWLSYL